jgi:hypothetical protein
MAVARDGNGSGRLAGTAVAVSARPAVQLTHRRGVPFCCNVYGPGG